MTDRINALTVVLNKDIRDDDVKSLTSAIKQLRGVLSVSMNVADITSHIAMQRARQSLLDELWKVFFPKVSKSDATLE